MPNTPGEEPEQEAEQHAKEAAQDASPWVDRFARFGYATKGLVYVVVGALAFGVAIGVGGAQPTRPAPYKRSVRSPSDG